MNSRAKLRGLVVVFLVVALVLGTIPSAALAVGVAAGAGGEQRIELKNQAVVESQSPSDVAGLLREACQRLEELKRVRKQTEASWQV
ncbi:MAG: hypothetical protein ACPLTR_07345, partial [Thermacetogeniaceae bacterium]